jgi:hypothetical protein
MVNDFSFVSQIGLCGLDGLCGSDLLNSENIHRPYINE